MPDVEPSEQHPRYAAVQQEAPSRLFMVMVDEGWRQSVMCSGMYQWAAEWLADFLQGEPYAPGRRP